MLKRLFIIPVIIFLLCASANAQYKHSSLPFPWQILDFSKYIFVQDEFLYGSSLASGQIGELGWIMTNVGSASGGTHAASSDANETGYFEMSSGTALNTGRVAYLTPIYIRQNEDILFRVNISTTSGILVLFGIAGAVTSAPTSLDHANDAIEFGFDPAVSGNWVIISEAATSRTQVVTGSTVSGSTWYNCRIVVSSNVVRFYVDGLEIGNITTNIPSVGTLIRPLFRIVNTDATEKKIRIGYFRIIQNVSR